MRRRTFLVSLATWLVSTTSLTPAIVIHNRVPWAPFPNAGDRTTRSVAVLHADEARAMEAIVDRAGDAGRVMVPALARKLLL
jgi:gluconate 2-dehydrogenase gamma chain